MFIAFNAFCMYIVQFSQLLSHIFFSLFSFATAYFYVIMVVNGNPKEGEKFSVPDDEFIPIASISSIVMLQNEQCKWNFYSWKARNKNVRC